MMLVIDCCIRGDDSATRRYYEAYLQAAGKREIQRLDLTKLHIAPLDGKTLQKRDALCAKGDFRHEMFHLARQFRDAEEILIAAPFWDLSFPALLKVYLEQISVSGLTFGYEKDGRCSGYCKAKRLLYFSTCGGYVGERHLGFEYIKALAAMLGIRRCTAYILEGMDLDPTQREAILKQGIRRLQEEEKREGDKRK